MQLLDAGLLVWLVLASTVHGRGQPGSGIHTKGYTFAEQDDAISSRMLQDELGADTVPARRTGYVVAWGSMLLPDWVPPDTALGVATITSTQFNGCAALLTNGSVIHWSSTQAPHIPSNGTAKITAIAAGRDHFIAIKDGAAVPLVPESSTGALTTGWDSVPPQAQSGVVQVAGGYWGLNVAISSSGQAIIWGTSGNYSVPKGIQVQAAAAAEGLVLLSQRNGSVIGVRFDGTLLALPSILNSGVAAVAAYTGGRSSYRTMCLAVLQNGTVVQWVAGSTHVQFPSIPGHVHTVSIGNKCGVDPSQLQYQATAVTDSGNLYAWDPTDLRNPTSTIPVSHEGAASVHVGLTGLCFWVDRSIGALRAWGGAVTPVPVAIPSQLSSEVIAIAAGGVSALVLLADGNLTMLDGSNTGNSTSSTAIQATAPSFGGLRPVAVAAGYDHFLVIVARPGQPYGIVMGWGGNNHNYSSNVPAAAQAGVKKVVAGRYCSAALLGTAGTIVVWGTSKDGSNLRQLNPVQGRYIDVAAGDGVIVGVAANGTAVIISPAHYPPPPAQNINVVSTSVGSAIGVALRSDGSTFAWVLATGAVLLPGPISFSYSMKGVTAVSVGLDDHVVFQMQQGPPLCDCPGAYCSNGIAASSAAAGVCSNIPSMLQSGTVMAVSAGLRYTLALVEGQAPPLQSPSPSPGSLPNALPIRTVAPRDAVPYTDNATDKSSGSLGSAAIAGIAVACGMAAAALVLASCYVARRRNRGLTQQESYLMQDWKGIKPPTLDIPGLADGEAFLLATAFQYPWADSTPQHAQPVEAGVNDAQLDSLDKQGNGSCQVVQLSREELVAQVQLCKDGLLGKGAAAVVFKCTWPNRFGPAAVLAAKVLSDSFNANTQILESFAYEAGVLANTNHPNVVKLYGYCLEPPTVCLILELLPASLKDVLYKHPGHGMHTTVPNSSCVATSNTQVATACSTLSSKTSSTSDKKGSGDISGVASTVDTTGSAVCVLEPTVCSGTATASPCAGSVRGAVMWGGQPDKLVPQAGQLLQLTPANSSLTATLSNPISMVRRLSPLEVAHISADIAAGLAYLHDNSVLAAAVLEEHSTPAEEPSRTDCSNPSAFKAHKVVHRDLKPANILFNSRGIAKISDFGLARQHTSTTVATMHLAAGTLVYMAPELLMAGQVGASTATNRMDIYSLGMMMWEMLSGQPPWQGLTQAAIMAGVINRHRPTLPAPYPETNGSTGTGDQRMPAVDYAGLQQLCNIITACWAPRELKRPTASAVHRMLLELVQQLDQDQVKDQQVSMHM